MKITAGATDSQFVLHATLNEAQQVVANSLSRLGGVKSSTPGKIKVQLMAVGRAPRLAQSKFIVQAKDSFRALFPVLRRLLQLRDDQALFVFVNSAFAPAPEDKFGDLFHCFGKTGTLIVNYSLDEAWG